MINLTCLSKSTIELFAEITPTYAAIKLDDEKRYMIQRLKEQSVVGGWWCRNGQLIRRLTRDESTAYHSIKNS